MQKKNGQIIRLSAEAVVRAFLSSGKKHLFLTGTRGIGKSVLCSAVCNLLKINPSNSIITEAVPKYHVLLKSGLLKDGIIIGIYDPMSDTPDQRMVPSSNGFSEAVSVLSQIAESNSEWASIDELGYLESSSFEFQNAVLRILDSKRTVIVLRKQNTPFLRSVISRTDAFVYNLDSPVLDIGLIITASGYSRRFGSNKLLTKINGIPMIEYILKASDTPVFSKRAVVTRYAEVSDICEKYGIPCLMHSFPYQNDTVRIGTEYTEMSDGCCFCTADQPFIRRESLETLALLFSHSPNNIFRASFGDKFGNPVLFPKEFYPELKHLPHDKGGSVVIKKYPDRVMYSPIRDIYELYDIDTSEDLKYAENIILQI